MIKFCEFLNFVTLLLICSCLNVNNPVSPHSELVIKKDKISNDEIWSGADTVYHINSDCSIEAKVTCQNGVVVVVDSGADLHIENQGVLKIEEKCRIELSKGSYVGVGEFSEGSLVVNGSASSPVVFKASNLSQEWGVKSDTYSGGIVFGSFSNNCSIHHCTISNAVAGIYVAKDSTSITNTTISFCTGDGIYFDSTAGPADSTSFNNITFSNCRGYPLTIPAHKLTNLTGNVIFNRVADGKNAIRIIGTKVIDSIAVWTKKSVPYHFTGATLISAWDRTSRVTIMPGVVCTFDVGACINIGDPRFGSGVLIARGTPQDSIYFISNSPNSIWGDSIGGIQVGMESPANTVFEYCCIRNATTGLFVNPGVRATISHCLVTGCLISGITFSNGGPVDENAFKENSCIGNSGYGMRSTADQLTNLSKSGSYIGNGKKGVFVIGTEVWKSGTWKNLSEPYVIDGIIDIGTSDSVSISIEPGVKFEFLQNSFIRVGNTSPGTLIASGSEESPILLTSATSDLYWGALEDETISGGIRIEQFAGTATTLSFCTSTNATNGVYVNAKAKIQNCRFNNNKYYGLIINKKADQSLVMENSFSGNGTGSTFIVP